MKRRDFIQQSAMAAIAAPALPHVAHAAHTIDESQGQVGQVEYAVLGLGSFASYAAPRIGLGKFSKITALISSDVAKAKSWAARYGVAEENIYDYHTLENISRNKQIDAVYIASPVGTHAHFATRALNAGKHVLTEKTMAATVTEAEAMIKAAEAANKKLMVAYRARFEPFNQAAIQMAREETLGKIISMDAHKGFSIGNNLGKDAWRLNKQLAGGGALVDIGIYSIQACRYIAGAAPVEVFAMSSNSDPRFREVEETISFTIRFSNGVLATGSASWAYGLQNQYRVNTAKGCYFLDPATSNENLRLFTRIGNEQTERFLRNADQVPVMFDHFSECILNNKQPLTDGYEGLNDLKLIEAIYQSVRENKPIIL